MPQSHEHLDILRTLGLKSGAIALTKTDRVDEAQISAVRAQIAALTEHTFLADAPIFATSSAQPASFEPLLAHLREHAARHAPTAVDAPFRMAIDRVFNVRGAGVIVTGTAHSGQLELEQTLYHYPSNRTVRVRGIRCQDQEQSAATSGERCALNISGLDQELLSRGDWLTAEPHSGFAQVTLQLDVLASFPRSVKHWTPVHVYHATRHTTGRIALLDDQTIAPGGSALVDLVIDAPLPAVHGDRLVLRDQSLDVTLGGGAVVHGLEVQSQRRRQDSRKAELAAFNSQEPTTALQALLGHGAVSIDAWRKVWGLGESAANALIAGLDAVHRVDSLLVSQTNWLKWQSQAMSFIEALPEQSNGIRENQLPAAIPSELRQPLLNELVGSGALTNEGGFYRAATQSISMPNELQALWATVEPALDVLQTPSCGDIGKQHNIPLHKLQRDMVQIAKLGFLVHLGEHRFYLPQRLQEIADIVKRMASSGPVSVKAFRDETGIGRNVAIEVLEYFDSKGFTRRQDNTRIVLRDDFQVAKR